MTRHAKLAIASLVAATLLGCGKESTPTAPSGQTSFLTGTWHGTVTIQVNPGDPNPPAPMTGEMTWTFEVVPDTNLQSLRATIQAMEQGKDIVMWNADPAGTRLNYVAVVKAKPISGQVSGKGGAGEVCVQVHQSFGSPYVDPQGHQRIADRCFVVCPHQIKKEALAALQSCIGDAFSKVTILAGDQLREIAPTGSPLSRVNSSGRYRVSRGDPCAPDRRDCPWHY